MITIKDVARLAGVSTATVSHVLNKSAVVSELRTNRVLEAVRQLNFVPSHAARSLKRANANEIGILLPDLENTYYVTLLKLLVEKLHAKGYRTNIAFSQGHASLEREHIMRMLSQNIRGLVLVTSQPHNKAFFEEHLKQQELPLVFLDRKPYNVECHHLGFDNEQAVYHITKSILQNGYKSPLLVCGPDTYSSEFESICGMIRACEESSCVFSIENVMCTNQSKEDAYKLFFNSFTAQAHPDCVVTTFYPAAEAILEASETMGIRIPEDMLLVSLAEQRPGISNQHNNVVCSSRDCSRMCEDAVSLLLGVDALPTEKYYPDDIIQNVIGTPQNNAFRSVSKTQSRLDILMLDHVTSHSISKLMSYFSRLYHIDLRFDFCSQNELFNEILRVGPYDLFMFDVPWLPVLQQNNALLCIDDFMASGRFDKNDISKKHLQSCMHNGSYFGIPFWPCTQLLFYRKDLFSDEDIAAQYKEATGFSLRPPLTWKEFNRTARFFTKKHNDRSPTEFGTSFAGVINEELAPELLIRLYAEGGEIFDKNNYPVIDSRNNEQAFAYALETLGYIPKDAFFTSIDDTITDFCNGKIAMLNTYSNFAETISSYSEELMDAEIGYSVLPGKTPLTVGWNLGISYYCEKTAEVYQLFEWLYQKDVNHRITILGGAAATNSAYSDDQLVKLYPWLQSSFELLEYSRDRNSPCRPHSLVIPRNRIEAILCNAFFRASKEGVPVQKALALAQNELVDLFETYGY